MPSTEESESGSDKTSSTEVTLEIPETVKTTETYALSVGVYRFRAVWGSVGLAAALLGVMQIFANNGVQVGSFRSVDLDPDGQKELLDTYNGRLASLTSTVMKPLDIFLSMLVAVVFLCLKTKWSVHFESRRQFVVVAIIGLVGYLLDYGFNSLNLQVVPGDIQPRIMPDDLALQTIVDVAQELSVDGFLVTTKDAKFREDSPDNSLLNTIMRNLIIAPEEVPTWCNDFDAYSSPHKNVMASYGFPARPWQQYALSKALEPTGSGSFPMTTAAVDLPPDRNLPMDESVATNLAVYALLVSNSFLGWWRGDNQAWTFSTAVHSTGTLSLAEHFNLTTRSSSDATFLSNAHKVIVDYFSRAENANTTDELARIEFSRVNLSEMIVFDALTIDIPTRKFGKQEDNSSASNPFYEPVSDYRCNTQACVLEKYEYMLQDGTNNELETTIYPRVQALGICLNAAGGEELVADFSYYRPNEVLQACEQQSNSSMIIVSVGKRAEGDSFEPATMVSDATASGQLVNARMVYSLTVGRLSWSPEHLSEVFNADCGMADGCYGIRFPLEQADTSNDSEVLIVSNSSIPMNLLRPINLNSNYQSLGSSKWKVLASTVEENRGAGLLTETRPALVVLPRNFKRVEWDLESFMLSDGLISCEKTIDNYLNNIEKNHLYIEQTLQPAYAAGFFFIFQNALTFKQVNVTDKSSKKSLGFSGNVQEMLVQASIPPLSFGIVALGCLVMIGGAVIIALHGKRCEEALLKYSTAATVVEAIENPAKFPPFMLQLQLRDTTVGSVPEMG